MATRETLDASTFHLLPTGTEMRFADADAKFHSIGDPDGSRSSFVVPLQLLVAPEASLQSVVLPLSTIALDSEVHLRCREVLSQCFWRLCCSNPSSFLAWPLLEHRLLSASSMHRQFLFFELYTWMCNFTGRMSFLIRGVPAADAKKADGTSTVILRIPRPPFFAGRVACVHWLSFMLTSVTHFHCSFSKSRS